MEDSLKVGKDGNLRVFDGESWSQIEWLRNEGKHDRKNYSHYKIVKIII